MVTVSPDMLFRGLFIASNQKNYFGNYLLSEGKVGETVTLAVLYGSYIHLFEKNSGKAITYS